jgi:predicted small lipoprotein YifL
MIRASLMAPRAGSRTVLWGAMLWSAAALALGACGRVGPLDQPAPLYGEKAKADYQARKKAEAAAAKASKDQDEPEPLASDTPGPDNPGAMRDNLRTNPAQGMRPLPDAPPPPNVLPDPYNRPQ